MRGVLSTTTVVRRIGTLTHVRLACASVSCAAMHRHKERVVLALPISSEHGEENSQHRSWWVTHRVVVRGALPCTRKSGPQDASCLIMQHLAACLILRVQQRVDPNGLKEMMGALQTKQDEVQLDAGAKRNLKKSKVVAGTWRRPSLGHPEVCQGCSTGSSVQIFF